jgi:hypothetical protein
MEIAAVWLSNCLEKHPTCSGRTEVPQLPTRVIDVGSLTHSPFLFISNGKAAHYITLSYTWGGQVPLRTTSESLSQRKLGIPLESLPQTFEDAVLFCRALGVQYLWIDALCIIQDSKEDWESEAGQMAWIFHNSLITLAVADANSPLDAMFRPRRRNRCRLYLLEPRIPFRNRFELGPGALSVVYSPTPKADPGARNPWSDDNADSTKNFKKPLSVLDTRGWVFQEQILSVRTLTFADGELYWDCACLNASETHPMGIPSPPGYNLQERDVQLAKTYILERKKLSDPAKFFRFQISWRALVELYSERKLTKSEDKLYAFQGITTIVKNNLGLDTFVGMMELDRTCLAWKVKPDLADLPKTRAEWRAPLWSWASVDVGVQFC